MGPWESVAAQPGSGGTLPRAISPSRETEAQARHRPETPRDLRENPLAALVVDRYDEDWTRLAWLMLQGRAEILHTGPEHDQAQTTLRARYPQFAPMRIAHLAVVAIHIDHATSWGRLEGE